MKLSDKYMEEYMTRYIGKNIKVLIEEEKDEYLIGHTTNYIMIHVKKRNSDTSHNKNTNKYINEILNIKVKKYNNFKLIGVIH